ncbi:unnamed protein product, partial [Amoebophrya sp. A120]
PSSIKSCSARTTGAAWALVMKKSKVTHLLHRQQQEQKRKLLFTKTRTKTTMKAKKCDTCSGNNDGDENGHLKHKLLTGDEEDNISNNNGLLSSSAQSSSTRIGGGAASPAG